MASGGAPSIDKRLMRGSPITTLGCPNSRVTNEPFPFLTSHDGTPTSGANASSTGCMERSFHGGPLPALPRALHAHRHDRTRDQRHLEADDGMVAGQLRRAT